MLEPLVIKIVSARMFIDLPLRATVTIQLESAIDPLSSSGSIMSG